MATDTDRLSQNRDRYLKVQMVHDQVADKTKFFDVQKTKHLFENRRKTRSVETRLAKRIEMYILRLTGAASRVEGPHPVAIPWIVAAATIIVSRRVIFWNSRHPLGAGHTVQHGFKTL